MHDVPKDKGTRVRFERMVRIAEYHAVHQGWTLDGVTAESLIFRWSDVQDISDDDLRALVNSAGLNTSSGSLTVSNQDAGFVFVNFNFEVL